MDETRAKRLAAELIGHEIGGWSIMDYINYGKSAVILKSRKNDDIAAIKIFDPELIERFGKKIQMDRVEREKILIGNKHPHLVEILDGGECSRTGLIFISMSYIPQRNLAEKVQYVPRKMIFQIINQIAQAAKLLEDLELAHRDIKPENIAISDDFSHATLLDMSVLRPVGFSHITDENDQRVFIGTLRYSPPELLYRREEDTIQGWRAITFYQLGAVLHDLIMKYPIFLDQSEPYATLVDAVRERTPEIKATDVDKNLIMLARSCLVKDPQKRLSLISWDDFMHISNSDDYIEDVSRRIKRRIELANMQNDPSSYFKTRRFHRIVDEIKSITRNICVDQQEYLPPHDMIKIVRINESEADIILCFESSGIHHIQYALTVLFRISYIASDDNIIFIKYAAFISETCPANVANEYSKYKLLFKGPFDSLSIKKRIYEMLLGLIDIVQEINIHISNDYLELD